ncbi:MAG TPA: hypothetical protein VI756_15865 [Blastocatellia bacterium]
MQTPESAKTLGGDASSFQVWQNDAPGIAGHYMFNIAIPINQDADLPIDLSRQLGKLPGKFLGDYLVWGYSFLIELLETPNLTRFQSVQVSFYASNIQTSLGADLIISNPIIHDSPDGCTRLLTSIDIV